jgi:hypothetical protein
VSILMMFNPRRSWVGLLAAALLAAVFVVTGPTKPASAALTCTSSTRVIAIRGSGEPYGNDGLGTVNAAAFEQIKRRIPDVQLYGLPYEAVSILPNPADKLVNQYWQSMNLGSAMLGRIVDEMIAACPYQRLILIAYSQGMHALGNLLARWGNNPLVRSHIAAILGFGDPMFNPANPFNRDVLGHPNFDRSLHGVFGSRTVSSVWWSTIRSYCADQDWICNYSSSNFAKCPPGTSKQCGHFSYVASGTAASAGAWAGNLARSLPRLAPPPVSAPQSPTTLPKAGATIYPHHIYHTCANGHCGLNVRTGPGYSNYGVIRAQTDGSVVQIVCQTRGQAVSGSDGSSSNVWDKLADGGYAADFYIDTSGMTGSFSPPIPVC